MTYFQRRYVTLLITVVLAALIMVGVGWYKKADPATVSNGMIVLFTIALVGIGFLQVELQAQQTSIQERQTSTSDRVAQLQERLEVTQKRIERAYIAVAPNPHSVLIADDPETADGKHICRLDLVLTNHGNTPARVTRVEIGIEVCDLGTQTPIVNQALDGASYLAKGDHALLPVRVGIATAAKEALHQQPRAVLALSGFVDFEDIFGDRYRRGFGLRTPDKETRFSVTTDDGSHRWPLVVEFREAFNYETTRP